MITKFKKPVAAGGTTIENEPVIKSDGASSDLMEWAASTGSSSIKIRENSANDLVLDVEGNLELADRVASVTSSTTVGAVFIYDTSQDSDGGKWRKKCKGLSWFDEAASATRSARSEFPAMALIVSDSASGVTIYDLDDPAMPVWMVFNGLIADYATKMLWASGNAAGGGLFALNGRVWLGRTWVDFTSDRGGYWWTGDERLYVGGIADRHSTSRTTNASFSGIVNDTVNDVAATVLEGAEIGALGLPIPTVAVATDGGISWIHPNGDVFDSTAYGAFDTIDTFGKDEWVAANNAATEVVRIFKTAFADGHTEHAGREYLATGFPVILDGDPVLASTSDGVAVGTPAGLSLIKDNPANSDESAVAHVTSDYNTGYMLGDIRGAWLAYGISCGHSHADHVQTAFSVKANTLTETGTLTKTAVATGADLTGFSGFSSSNYLSRASDTDFDFGTGDFSIMFWVKSGATGTYEDYMSRGDATQEANDFLISKRTNEKLVWYHNSGSTWTEIKESTGTVGTSWMQVVAVRRGGVFNWYLNGEFDSSATDANSYTPSGGSSLAIGRRLEASYPAANASLSLLRISATAPTPQQIKEIYDAEKPLFAANAKCLLQSPHASLSNVVNDLSYDESTGLLAVAQTAENYGVQLFRGLEMAEATSYEDSTSWSSSTASLISTAGGVVAPFRGHADGGVLVDLPALDVRAELNEGDDKLPDDGKLHFSGVTTDATVTTIGNIPVAENESVNVVCKIWSKKYGQTASSYYLNGEIHQRYYRAYGDVVEADESAPYKLIDTGAATMDVDLEEVTASNTVAVKVTGMSAARIEWTASVEVQRISEKTYER